MAKGWKNFGNINGLVKSSETPVEMQRRFNKADTMTRVTREFTPISDDYEYKKHLEDTYKKAIANEDHLIDVVDNKRTTNKILIERAEKIKAARAKKEKKNVSNKADNKS